MKCPYCGTQLSGVYFSTICPKCSKSLHTCVSCKFYLKGAHYDCKEDVDEIITDKSRNNFCSYFSLTEDSIKTTKNEVSAEDLFNSFFT